MHDKNICRLIGLPTAYQAMIYGRDLLSLRVVLVLVVLCEHCCNVDSQRPAYVVQRLFPAYEVRTL